MGIFTFVTSGHSRPPALKLKAGWVSGSSPGYFHQLEMPLALACCQEERFTQEQPQFPICTTPTVSITPTLIASLSCYPEENLGLIQRVKQVQPGISKSPESGVGWGVGITSPEIHNCLIVW